MPDSWTIEPLGDAHDRAAFACGKPSLDAFLRTQAGQYARKSVGRTFVAVETGETVVLGYYTLAASAIAFAELPVHLGKKLPKHPVPTILLGRLAVDQSTRGRGLGTRLIQDALARSIRIADQIGVFAVNVHALDEDARAFYSRFGFVSLPENERHMVLPIESIRKSMK